MKVEELGDLENPPQGIDAVEMGNVELDGGGRKLWSVGVRVAIGGREP